MPIKTYSPTTPTRRFQTVVSRDDITKEHPEKSLVEPKQRTGGRNSTGRVTSRFIGGGHKQAYRVIDFKRDKHGIPAIVAAIEYDPEPLGAHRAAALRRRREALHSAAGRSEGRAEGDARGRRPIFCWAMRCR